MPTYRPPLGFLLDVGECIAAIEGVEVIDLGPLDDPASRAVFPLGPDAFDAFVALLDQDQVVVDDSLADLLHRPTVFVDEHHPAS